MRIRKALKEEGKKQLSRVFDRTKFRVRRKK